MLVQLPTLVATAQVAPDRGLFFTRALGMGRADDPFSRKSEDWRERESVPSTFNH